MLKRVTENKYKTTDIHVLNELKKLKINKDGVKFHDYCRERPYQKLYEDLNSNIRIQVISQLPMVRKTDGTKLISGFEKSGDVYYLKNNLFDGFVDYSGGLHIANVNEQPNGTEAFDELLVAPVLRIGSEIVALKLMTALETDPMNENYHDNVLELDYGVCKRWIRVIEGRFHGYWIFDKNPKDDIRIDYNKNGNLPLKLHRAHCGNEIIPVSMPAPYVELVKRKDFKFPLIIGDSAVFYPDFDPETNTVDGYTQRSVTAGAAWTTLIAGAGTGAIDDGTTAAIVLIDSHATDTDEWRKVNRGIMLFNTATLGEVTVSGTVLSLRGSAKTDAANIAPDINIYSSNPATNTAIIAADHSTLGATDFANTITYENWKTSDPFWNDFTFVAAGIAAVNTGGITKVGTRNRCYDVLGVAPTWPGVSALTSSLSCTMAEQGTGYKPTLTVTYSAISTGIGANYINMNPLGITTYRTVM